METWIAGLILLVIKLGVVLVVLLLVAAYLVWVERKLIGRMQVRYGPNRAGRFGLLQPLADLIKLVTKEDTVPGAADKTIFLLAPAVVATTAMLIFAVIPFGKQFHALGQTHPHGHYGFKCRFAFCHCPLFPRCLRRRLRRMGFSTQNIAFWAGFVALPR